MITELLCAPGLFFFIFGKLVSSSKQIVKEHKDLETEVSQDFSWPSSPLNFPGVLWPQEERASS
jgi:hypothetical protein